MEKSTDLRLALDAGSPLDQSTALGLSPVADCSERRCLIGRRLRMSGLIHA